MPFVDYWGLSNSARDEAVVSIRLEQADWECPATRTPWLIPPASLCWDLTMLTLTVRDEVKESTQKKVGRRSTALPLPGWGSVLNLGTPFVTGNVRSRET